VVVLYVRFFESLALWTLFTHPTDNNLIVRGKNDLSVITASGHSNSISRNCRNLAVIAKSLDVRSYPIKLTRIISV
jgi:hypothetical protein